MYRSLIIVAAVLASAAPARAEPEVLDVDPAQDWVHAPTGVRLPAQIKDLARDRITSFLAGENNIGTTYFSPDDSEILSIYVYRSGSYDVSMMADAAIAAMSTNDQLGSIAADSAIFSTFGDAAIGQASGVAATFSVVGDYRLTGLALFRTGNWLVKIRLSSKRTDAETLDRRLRMLAAGLPVDPSGRTAPPAYRIAECGDIPPRGEAARRTLAMADWIIATTVVSLSYDETAEDEAQGAIAPEETSRLCRDRRSEPGRMFYRDAESGEPRAIVFGDSGTVSQIGETAISLEEAASPPVVLSIGNGMRTEFYAGFESVPGFAQMIRTLEDGVVQASVARTDDGSEIPLNATE